MARIIVGLVLGVVVGVMLAPLFIGTARVIPECAQVTRWEDGSGKWSACDERVAGSVLDARG